MTRWLVTGAAGMLGRDLQSVLAARDDVKPTLVTRAELDITDPSAVAYAVAGNRVVVNAAGWTDVDGAEANEAAATRVNGAGAGHLAAACRDHGALLLHVSTDYVFAGDATVPYAEDAPVAPINAYGRSKLAGEEAVLRLLPRTGYVVRTAWLYGEHGRNFVTTILRLSRQRERIEIVADQHGQPTWSRCLAVRLTELADAALAGRAPAGVYHGTASGKATWFELAQETYRHCGLSPERVHPIGSAAYAHRPAPRPAYTVLGHDRWAAAGFEPLPDWRDMLGQALDSPGIRTLWEPPQ